MAAVRDERGALEAVAYLAAAATTFHGEARGIICVVSCGRGAFGHDVEGRNWRWNLLKEGKGGSVVVLRGICVLVHGKLKNGGILQKRKRRTIGANAIFL